MDQRFEHTARERRDNIGSVLKKSADCPVDIHSNGQEVHPIDALANAVEKYGTAYLLSVLKKQDLKKLVDCLHLPESDSPTSKRDMKLAIKAKVAEMGALKFMKKNVPEPTLHVIALSLGLPDEPPQERKELIEAIFKQLTMNGLEKFSKKVHTKEVKTALHETAENHKPKENGCHEHPLGGSKGRSRENESSETKRRKSSGKKDLPKKQHLAVEHTPDKSRPVDSLSDQDDEEEEEVKPKPHKETKPIDMTVHSPFPKGVSRSPKETKRKTKEQSPPHTAPSPRRHKDRES